MAARLFAPAALGLGPRFARAEAESDGVEGVPGTPEPEPEAKSLCLVVVVAVVATVGAEHFSRPRPRAAI
jgi:hypothetical protein